MKKLLNLHSIRLKLLGIPLASVLIAILVIAFSVTNITERSLLNQMKSDGLLIANQAVSQLEMSSSALEIINSSTEADIRTLGGYLNANIQSATNNEYLTAIAKQFEVDEINLADASGTIEYSNLPTSIGTVFGKEHKAQQVLGGGAAFYVEDIRKSKETGDYYKYGYVKRSDGGVIQIGILANKIQTFTDSVGYQYLINNLSKNEEIVYALFIDPNLKATAHSDPERIGISLDDEGSKTAIQQGKTYTSTYYYEKEKTKVYDIILPIKMDGKVLGAIDIGLSMKNTERTINQIILLTTVVSAAAYVLISLILFFVTNRVIKPIQQLAKASKQVADGELYHEITAKGKDEVGALAFSFRDMVIHLRDVVSGIQGKADQTDDMSAQLATASTQLSSASSEVATAIQHVAEGTASQADELTQIVELMSELAEHLDGIQDKMAMVKHHVDGAEDKAGVGKENIELVSSSSGSLTTAVQEVHVKLTALEDSVSQIGMITQTINGISNQTNLLALNAAIEASRAGEAGAGFAVVAGEVRKLAEQSKIATEQIQALIESIAVETKEVLQTSHEVEDLMGNQVQSVELTTDSFRDILEAVSAIAPLIEETSLNIQNTLQTKDIVVDKVSAVSAFAQEMSASSEEISASSEEMLASAQEVSSHAGQLNDISVSLNSQINQFQLKPKA